MSDAIAEQNCQHQPGVTAGVRRGASAAAADPQLPGNRGSSCWGSVGAGLTPGEGHKWEMSPEESTWQLLVGAKPVDAAGRIRGALGMLLEGFVVLWGLLQPHLHSTCRKRDDI